MTAKSFMSELTCETKGKDYNANEVVVVFIVR